MADTQQQLPAITYWLMGSLSSIKDKDVVFLAIPVALGMIPLFFLRWRMNLLTVGEEEAQSMGVNTRQLRGAVIVCATLLTSASAVILAHNHPSGVAVPSSSDEAATRQVAEALRTIGVRLVDHIVVADRDFVSMADSGDLLG